MRNLMGRLNARSDEELQRISTAWMLPGSARDRAGLIAQLMRAMTDLRAVRDFWDRQSPGERAMISSFVTHVSDTGATIGELASILALDETTARDTAIRLYQAGALSSNANQQPMQVGEIPRLFIPRELSQLFARLHDELDAGDISQATPSSLLALLDDADIQRAAELWGLEAIPGLRTRRELTDGLLELAVYPDRRAMVERKLGWDARRVFGIVSELPAGRTVPLASVTEALDLVPDLPRTADRLRTALRELEESLLVWHTWLPDGSRALFQPIWHPGDTPPREPQHPPDPVELEPAERALRHPAALAWDLLTLLRWLGAGTPELAAFSSVTPSAQRRLDTLLWIRGGDDPVPGYLEFLATLADYGNLLDPPDPETRVNRALRQWRSRSFDEQVTQLLAWWLSAPTWIEAQDQEEVVVTGAHWPQFRRRLLVLLAELAPERWYRLNDLIRWSSRRSSDSLGIAVQIATARPIDTSLDRSTERLSLLEHVVERTLRSGFAWFGLVELAHVPSSGEVVRVTETGRIAAGVAERTPPEPLPGAPLEIYPDLTVTLREPSPVRIWSLTAFADQIRLAPNASYRITNRSLKRALSAGFQIDDVVTFLERQAGEPLDPNARAQLQAWSESMGRVWLTPMVLIQPEQDEEARFLLAPLERAGLQTLPHTGGILVKGPEGMSATMLGAHVESILREAGKTPQFHANHQSLTENESGTGEDGAAG